MKRELNVKQNEPYLNPLHDTHHARKMKLFSLTVRRPDTTFQDESCQNPITVLYENVQYLLGVNMKFRKWSMVHVLSAKSTSIYRFLHDFILSYHIGMYLQLMHLQLTPTKHCFALKRKQAGSNVLLLPSNWPVSNRSMNKFDKIVWLMLQTYRKSWYHETKTNRITLRGVSYCEYMC